MRIPLSSFFLALCLRLCLVALGLAVLPLTSRPAGAQVIGYTIDYTGLNQVDLGSGELTAVGPMGSFVIHALDFDPAGTLYGIDGLGEQLVTIDTDSGAATAVGPLGIEIENLRLADITFDACGGLWLTNGSIFVNSPSMLYSVDPTSGAATLVGDMGRRVVSITASGDRLLGLARVVGPFLDEELVDIDPLTAELSSPRRLDPLAIVPPWIDYDQAGILWGLNTGLVIAPPEPALTWVIEPKVGGSRIVAEAGSFTLLSGLSVGRPHGVCASGACRPGAERHCMVDRRFLVEVEWQDFNGNRGRGRTVPGANDGSGVFWFFDPSNWEVQFKVLNGCAINGHFWVFSSATTNVEFVLRVTDTETGEIREYMNPLGETAAAVIDTSAFAICDGG